MTLPLFVETCAQLGLDGFDLLDPTGYAWLWAGGGIEQAARLVEKHGIPVAAYGCGNNFAKLDPDERRKQIEYVKDAIGRARDCGAETIRIFGGYHQGTGGEAGITKAKGLELVMEGIEACLPKAESCGVVLALENHGGLPGHSFESRAVLNAFRSPWLKVTFDPANYLGNNMGEPEDPLRAFAELKEEIAYVHLKDVWAVDQERKPRTGPCVPGDGMTPLRQVIAELTRAGYSGFCSLEYEAFETMPEPEGVAKSFVFIKDAVENARLLSGARS